MADPSVSAISSNPSDDYIEWAQESLGVIVHHPLRLGSAPGKEERGVYCEQDIPADTIVVSVPWEVSHRPLAHTNLISVTILGA